MTEVHQSFYLEERVDKSRHQDMFLKKGVAKIQEKSLKSSSKGVQSFVELQARFYSLNNNELFYKYFSSNFPRF